MRCKHCYRSIHVLYSMWRRRSDDSYYCYASPSGYHEV